MAKKNEVDTAPGAITLVEYSDAAGLRKHLHARLVALCPKDMMSASLQYRFRTYNDIVRALDKVLPAGAEISLDEEIKNVGGHNYLHCTASLSFKGEVIFASGHARESETFGSLMAPQLTGTASTYAKKYALENLFLMYDALDPDFIAGTAPGKSPFATDSQRAQFVKNLEDNLLNAISIAELDEIDKLNAARVVAMKSGVTADKEGYNQLVQAKRQRITELKGGAAGKDNAIDDEIPF